MSAHYGRRTRRDRNRPRVLDVAPGLVYESGPHVDRSWTPQRVVVMAHWATAVEPTRSVVAMLQGFDAAGYETVLVSAAEAPGRIGRTCTWAPGGSTMPEGTTVLRRANVGYDFGSWAAVLAGFPSIRRADQVLLVNDSVIGPLGALAPVLQDFDGCSAPAWGLVRSNQHRPHIQTFFFGFKERALDSPEQRRFWSGIRAETRKAKVVRYGELSLTESLDAAGVPWVTMFDPWDWSSPGSQVASRNPALDDWERLVCAGSPFVKYQVARQCLRSAHLPVGFEGLGEWLPPPGGAGAVELQDEPSRSLGVLQRARYRWDLQGIRRR